MNLKSNLCAKNYLSLVEEIRSDENISIKDFDIGLTLGNGTFGKVKQVQYKKVKSDFVFALKILKKKDLVKLNQVRYIYLSDLY
jgi:hypothetical protein